ncbi:MAG: RNA degradosome polyphosphate kinase, partial [Pyrinomonadaceae bacterium]
TGLSENIRVVSIVGRFLEHSRVFYFLNNHEEEVLIGSADWMHRNLDRRVEVVVPVRDKGLIGYIRDTLLYAYLRDNQNSKLLGSDGNYSKLELEPGEAPFDAQMFFVGDDV